MVRRIIFRQQPGESVHHYVPDLRGLASLCKFGTLKDEFIRDQLAEHTIDSKQRDKLLTTPNDLPLSKAVEIALQLESVNTAVSGFRPPGLSPASTDGVPAPQVIDPNSPHDNMDLAGRQGATACRSGGNCGSSSHTARASVCPATGQRCQRCGKLNHFSRVCPSAPLSTSSSQRSSNSSPTTIHSVGSCAKPFKWCTVELDGICLPLLLDTAASRSPLSESTILHLFPSHAIRPDAEKLYGYGHTNIGMWAQSLSQYATVPESS
ncbi:uncharacterized protein LOC112486473 [Cynoglossus semilaevis]|uniref:uncharacterized protein LOC112486473 n=1 Tax=Cynoglossus semilaevis TaxID=244447 RepID=UPI000D62A0B5|nr:uncharacterized protein LOC112486473 [Cynoglossus semilaevis]